MKSILLGLVLVTISVLRCQVNPDILTKSPWFDEFSAAQLQGDDSETDEKIDVVSTTGLTITVRLKAN